MRQPFLFFTNSSISSTYHFQNLGLMSRVLILCLVVPLATMATASNSSFTNREGLQPWCDNSPNTNVSCYANTSGHNSGDTCLEIWDTMFGNIRKRVAKSCNSSAGIFHVQVYLDHPEMSATFFEVRLTNGSEFNADRLNLVQKVIPDPPININVVRVNDQSFNVSYEYPDSWYISSKAIYQCERYIAYLGRSANVSTKDGLYAVKNRKVITIRPLQPETLQLPGHTHVCFRCRFRYGYYNTIFSNYSLLGCDFTSTKAPSGPPLNLTILERKDARRVTLEWEPPSKSKRNGIITGYKILLKPSQDNSTPDAVINVNGTSKTIELIDPHEDYEIRLYASTSAGFSEEYAFIQVNGTEPPNTVLFVVTGSLGFLSLLILLRVIYILRRKMQSRHLPEPYLIPEARMVQYLSRKGFLPKQEKEVFDILKTGEESSSNKSKSDTEGNSREEKSDSGVLTDCEDQYEGSGVSVYSLRIKKEKPAKDVMEQNYVNERKFENATNTSEMKDYVTANHVEHQYQNGYENTNLKNEGNCEQRYTIKRTYYNC